MSDPTVIAVDGQWGSGKTIFLKMWAGELRKAGFPVVYFDAFENDYVDDAFLAIASEIIALAKAKEKGNRSKAKKFTKSAVAASKVLLRSSLKLGVKAATLGAVASADFEEVASDLASEASDLVDKHLGELLTQKKRQKDAIQGFRDALAALPSLLADHHEKEEAQRPLVFIIDELDRCRPTFALEILERIKHFFSVPNVHFVLGVHLDQLRNSVIVAYGPKIDAQTYLQKFVHLTFHLLDRERYRHERTVSRFLNYLEKAMDFKMEDRRELGTAIRLVRHVSEQRNLSLRAIERIMSCVAIAFAYAPQNIVRLPIILGGLCVLKVIEPRLFEKAKRGQLQFDDIREPLALERHDNEDDGVNEWAVNWWRYCTGGDLDEKAVMEYAGSLSRYGLDSRSDIVPFIANDVIDRFTLRKDS